MDIYTSLFFSFRPMSASLPSNATTRKKQTARTTSPPPLYTLATSSKCSWLLSLLSLPRRLQSRDPLGMSECQYIKASIRNLLPILSFNINLSVLQVECSDPDPAVNYCGTGAGAWLWFWITQRCRAGLIFIRQLPSHSPPGWHRWTLQ